jgi:signal transduction histidine kinase
MRHRRWPCSHGVVLSLPVVLAGCHPHDASASGVMSLALAAVMGLLCASALWAWVLWRERRLQSAAQQAMRSELQASLEAQRQRAAFITEASHEIRTPINAVSGALELMSRETLSPGVLQHLGLARTATMRLQEFVNNVLDLSKSDAGRLAIHLQDEDLAAALADVVVMLRHLADHKGVVLDLIWTRRLRRGSSSTRCGCARW